jgi:hypothetical protein
VDPILGLAFSQATTATDLAEDARLAALLKQWVASGLCTEEKQTALLAWPAARREKYDGYARPALFRSWVDVKLVCQADGTFVAKAYLGFMPSSSLF